MYWKWTIDHVFIWFVITICYAYLFGPFHARKVKVKQNNSSDVEAFFKNLLSSLVGRIDSDAISTILKFL